MGILGRLKAALSSKLFVSAAVLKPFRAWNRRSSRGQRPRLAAGPDGRLLCAWTEPIGPKKLRATLESASGAVLEQEEISIGNAEYHPALAAEGHLLVLDGRELHWGGSAIASGRFEAYALASGTAVVWEPGAEGVPMPHPAAVIHGPPWESARWNRTLFGVDMLTFPAGKVAIATRESGASAGWTLRVADELALSRGLVVEVQASQTWKPPRTISLEDPMLVAGAAVPTLCGGAFDMAGQRSSGKIFLAESGGPLKEVLQAARSDGNSEPVAVVHNGVLYVAAEIRNGVGVWKWTAGKLRIAAHLSGQAPSLASAEGFVWASTTQGLYRL
jgi:hypothetical protein